MSTNEYARLHGMDERRVRRMCETGAVQAVRMGGGFWLIEEDGEGEPAQDAPREETT